MSTAAQLRLMAICCKLGQQMSRLHCSAAVAGPTGSWLRGVLWLQVVCRLRRGVNGTAGTLLLSSTKLLSRRLHLWRHSLHTHI